MSEKTSSQLMRLAGGKIRMTVTLVGYLLRGATPAAPSGIYKPDVRSELFQGYVSLIVDGSKDQTVLYIGR